MAAFERLSKVLVPPIIPGSEIIDVRYATLPFETPSETDFDPLQFRSPKEPIEPWMARFIILRCAFSAAVLGMPMAISQIGIVLGPIVILASGALMIHMHLTLEQVGELGGRPLLCSGTVLATSKQELVAGFMIACQIGICTVCVLLTADNLRDMMDWPNARPALYWMYIPFILLELVVKTLKKASFISLVGSLSTTLGVLLITISIFLDPHGYMKKASTTVMSFFIGLGLVFFNLSNIGIILSCDKALEDPKMMTSRYGAVTTGIGFSTVIAVLFGSLGYWSFGDMEDNVLRALPYDEFLTMLIFGVYFFCVSLLYPLQCYPGVQMILDVVKNQDVNYTPSEKSMTTFEYMIRPLFVTLTFIIAYYVPFQASVVAFVGNLCTTMLSLIFPALMEICLLYPHHYGPYYYLLLKDIAIVVLGFMSWVVGVYHTANHLYILVRAIKSPNTSEFK